jgi:hypothetical protein
MLYFGWNTRIGCIVDGSVDVSKLQIVIVSSYETGMNFGGLNRFPMRPRSEVVTADQN